MQRHYRHQWLVSGACQRAAVLVCLFLGFVLSVSGQSQTQAPVGMQTRTPTSTPANPVSRTTAAAPPTLADTTAVTLLEDLQGRRVLPVDNWWNLDISQAPTDPGSAAFINFLNGRSPSNPTATRSLHPDFGPPPYGIPYVTVGSAQPPVVIGAFTYAGESDAGVPGEPPGYPIPDEARTLPNYIEGGVPGGGSSGDRHMLIVDRDRWLLFETYETMWNAADSQWEAGSGAVFDLSSNNRRPEGWTSADAAGLAILPGLVRYDEVYGTGEIRHALRFTSRASNGYVWPASHVAGNTAGALPFGARLRLKASVNISGFPAPVRKIFEAMKKYGLLLADNGSDLYITGTMDGRWDNDVLNPAFAQLDGDDFEVVELGWNPATPTITWDTPPPIVQGTALSGAQLDATANVAGTFVYTPPAGTVLPFGLHTLSVTFTPTDTANYAPATDSVSLVVMPFAFGATRSDFDGDLKSDVLWRHATRGEVWLWPMDGAARTSETFVRTVPDTGWEIRGLGDQTGDSQADVLWRHATTGAVYLWPMDGSTVLSETYVATVDPAYDIVGTGDYNGDGRSDILWRHLTNGEVWIWLMDGATPLSQVYVDTVDPGYLVKGSGDVNADGQADIVWRHTTNGQVWVWLMNGALRTSQTHVGTVGDLGYEIVGVADHTGDGQADILWRHATRGEVWIWPMDGTTVLSEAYVDTVPDTGYRIVGSGDYDGDGQADILWHHATRGEVWVWLMDGTTRLSQTWVATVPELGYQIVKSK
jgi:hypothetical protein